MLQVRFRALQAAAVLAQPGQPCTSAVLRSYRRWSCLTHSQPHLALTCTICGTRHLWPSCALCEGWHPSHLEVSSLQALEVRLAFH